MPCRSHVLMRDMSTLSRVSSCPGEAKAELSKTVIAAENPENIVRGLNIFKDSPEEVKVKPDSEYPDWVFTLHIPRASFEELSKKYVADETSLPEWDQKRMIKLWNRKRIRDSNEKKKK